MLTWNRGDRARAREKRSKDRKWGYLGRLPRANGAQRDGQQILLYKECECDGGRAWDVFPIYISLNVYLPIVLQRKGWEEKKKGQRRILIVHVMHFLCYLR